MNRVRIDSDPRDFAAVAVPGGTPAGRRWPGTAPRDLARADVLVLVFRCNETRLRPGELVALRQWVRACLRQGRPCRVVAGCCPDTARQARLVRWHELCEDLARCGVPPGWIECTDDWSEPAWHAPASALPEDAIWLRAVDVAVDGRTRQSPHDIRAGGRQNTGACTSAS